MAEIKAAEDIEGADKLYKLAIDSGKDLPAGRQERTIVAGIKPFYSKDELVGKKIVVVTNLEPRTLRGIESRGMLLAASTEDRSSLTLITVDRQMPNGSKIS